jgi:hypothetical protein
LTQQQQQQRRRLKLGLGSGHSHSSLSSSHDGSSLHLPHGMQHRVRGGASAAVQALGHGAAAVVAAEGLGPQPYRAPHRATNATAGGSSSGGGSGGSGGGSGGGGMDSGDGSSSSGGVITVYLATDALDLREQFATRLKAAVLHLLSHEHGPAGHGTSGLS